MFIRDEHLRNGDVKNRLKRHLNADSSAATAPADITVSTGGNVLIFLFYSTQR